jgi:hypothetical protein
MSAGLTQLIRSLALMTLIKNLGRHSLPLLKGISSRDSTTRLERSLSICHGLLGRKIYPITLLDIENSDRTKIHGASLAASTPFMRERAMNVHMKN